MNWKQALSLGLCSVGAYVQKEPVTYSYNGTVLPALPNSELPYAVIAKSTLGTYLSFGNVAPTWDGGNIKFVDGAGAKYKLDSNMWVFNTADKPSISWVNFTANIIWSNVDVVNSDTGNVVRVATDPIPVYE